MGETCMKTALRPALKPLALALSLLGVAVPVHAFQFNLGSEVKGSFDTTISYGMSIRDEGRDIALVGIANGGSARSVNEDDGDLNFDKGKAFANVLKATSEIDLRWRNFGFFGRGSAYYDFDLHDSNKLGPTGRDRLGEDVVGLDGFVFANFSPGGKNLRLRAGRQVISWGESTFIPNGINVINPVDLSKLRIPGAELKEGFIPTAGIWGSQEVSDSVTVEGFYLTNHDKIRLDPRGSYFSNNDFASDDANRVILSFGRRQDEHFPPGNPVPPGLGPLTAGSIALYGPFVPAASVWAPRSADRDPSDSGQYGIALRYLAKGFNNTEFGFYHMNYHSRIPLFSGIKGRPTSALTFAPNSTTPGSGPLLAAICANPALLALCHTGTATYFAEYPEDIKLYGLSFNTQGPWGVAMQGEYSYRPNQPVQYATPELLLAALGLPNLITGFTQIPGATPGATAAALIPDGTYLQGFRRLKMSQLQVTGTKSWPNVLGAEQGIIVGEVGFTWFHGLPGDVKFNGPAVFLPATTLGSTLPAIGAFSMQTDGFLTDFSWGFRLAARLEYNNLIFGGNVSPRIAYSDDVRGVGPTFNEKAKSFSVGATWDYQRRWGVDVQYTNYFGGRTFCGTDVPGSSVPGQSASWCSSAYPLKDRDWYSFTVSYSF
jgi:hypothetical protein